MQRDDRRRERSWKRATSCGVSAISGTSTSAPCPPGEHALDQPQVHLGLAAARDAVQQECGVPPERGADRAAGRGLVGGQHRSGAAGSGARRRLGPLQRLEPAARGERLQRRPSPASAMHFVRDAAVADQVEQLPLPESEARRRRERREAALRQVARRCSRAARCRLREASTGIAREQHFAERMVVIVRGPAEQREGDGIPQRFRVDASRARASGAMRAASLFVRDRGDDADRAALAERHAHALARQRAARLAGRRQVVEAAAQRRVQDDLQDGLDLGAKKPYLSVS